MRSVFQYLVKEPWEVKVERCKHTATDSGQSYTSMLSRFPHGANLAASLTYLCNQIPSVAALGGLHSHSSSSVEQGSSAIETPENVVTAQTDEVKKVSYWHARPLQYTFWHKHLCCLGLSWPSHGALRGKSILKDPAAAAECCFLTGVTHLGRAWWAQEQKACLHGPCSAIRCNLLLSVLLCISNGTLAWLGQNALHIWSPWFCLLLACPGMTCCSQNNLLALQRLPSTICRTAQARLELSSVQVQQPSGDATARVPAESWVEMTYPFSSSPFLQDQYRHFNTHLWDPSSK